MPKFIHNIHSKFKLSFFLLLGFPLVLTGCNTMSSSGVPPAGDDAVAGQLAGVDETQEKVELKPSEVVEADDAEVTEQASKPAVSMDGDMLFNLLAAEFAGNSGDIDASLAYYREASKSIEDSRRRTL